MGKHSKIEKRNTPNTASKTQRKLTPEELEQKRIHEEKTQRMAEEMCQALNEHTRNLKEPN